MGDMGGLELDSAIASNPINGKIMVRKNVNTPNNLPTATAQLVIGDVASSSKVPRLRSSA